MRIYGPNAHRSRAQMPDIDSRRNGWLMDTPVRFDPLHLTNKWVCDPPAKFPAAWQSKRNNRHQL